MSVVGKVYSSKFRSNYVQYYCMVVSCRQNPFILDGTVEYLYTVMWFHCRVSRTIDSVDCVQDPTSKVPRYLRLSSIQHREELSTLNHLEQVPDFPWDLIMYLRWKLHTRITEDTEAINVIHALPGGEIWTE